MHNSSAVSEIHAADSVIIMKDQGWRHSEAACVTCIFQNTFWAPSNVIKYDTKTNPNAWLGDYRLTCRVGRANDNLFIIQFLPIYLVVLARAWLDHLSWNTAVRISGRSSPATSRAPTCVLATPSTWRVGGRTRVNPSVITFDTYPRSAMNSRGWPKPMSSCKLLWINCMWT
jgi:hypothetical protein